MKNTQINIKQFLKPHRKKIFLFILIFVIIEIILWIIINACAYSCPMPPTPCQIKCLLNPQYFISATVINVIISYLVSCLLLKDKN